MSRGCTVKNILVLEMKDVQRLHCQKNTCSRDERCPEAALSKIYTSPSSAGLLGNINSYPTTGKRTVSLFL
jgi:hypothetical protein